MPQLQTLEPAGDEGTRRGDILEAAQEIFIRYGFRRAALERLARMTIVGFGGHG